MAAVFVAVTVTDAAAVVTTAAALAVALADPEPRPSWKTGPSVCNSFQGFQPIDLFPIRSPLAVADFLGPQLAVH